MHRVCPTGPSACGRAPEVLWTRPPAPSTSAAAHVPRPRRPVAAFVQACVNAVASYDMVSLASLRDVVQVGAAVGRRRARRSSSLAGAMGVRAVPDRRRRPGRRPSWRWDPPRAPRRHRGLARLRPRARVAGQLPRRDPPTHAARCSACTPSRASAPRPPTSPAWRRCRPAVPPGAAPARGAPAGGHPGRARERPAGAPRRQGPRHRRHRAHRRRPGHRPGAARRGARGRRGERPARRPRWACSRPRG